MNEKPLSFTPDDATVSQVSQTNSNTLSIDSYAATNTPAAPHTQSTLPGAPIHMQAQPNATAEAEPINLLLQDAIVDDAKTSKKEQSATAGQQPPHQQPYAPFTASTGNEGTMPPQPPMFCCPFAAGGALNPKKSWRQRHPFLFWLLILILAGGIFRGLAVMQSNNMLAEPQVGVVNIEGIIMESQTVVNWIETLRTNPNVKGVVVRVNSPGGAVGPSQEIYGAVKRLAGTKPVVVSMGALAASGGYYIALGGHEIYASPSTLTASIGVIMDIPNFEGLLKTLGITSKTLATGSLKGAGSTTREMTPEEETYLQSLLQDMYEEFIGTVADNRKMSLDDVKKVADGRSMTGRQALKAGLVDALGDFTDAKQRVLALSNLSSSMPVQVLEGPEKPGEFWRQMMESVLGFQITQKITNQQMQFYYQ